MSGYQDRLNEIKKRYQTENQQQPTQQSQQYDPYKIDFSTFLHRCIQSRYDPHMFFKMINHCYSILKWILLKNEIVKQKEDIPYYTMVTAYFKQLKIDIAPYQNSDSKVIFSAQNDQVDRSAIAKVCLTLYEQYIEYYLDNKKQLSSMTNETFYFKMEIYQSKCSEIQTQLSKSLQYNTYDEKFFMNDEELKNEIKSDIQKRELGSINVKRFYKSIITKTDNKIRDKEKSKEEVQRELDEYRKNKRSNQQKDQTEQYNKENSFTKVVGEVIIFMMIVSIIIFLLRRYIYLPLFG